MSHAPAGTAQAPPATGEGHVFSGQPQGRMRLSGPEVRERFPLPGMRAVLVLSFAGTVSDGVSGMAPGTAERVSAAGWALVPPASLTGGRQAGRIPASCQAVLDGGLLHAMAVPAVTMTGAGPGPVSAGAGLLTPDAASTAGGLHGTRGQRRDDAFAPCRTGISTGAFAGPLVTGRPEEHAGRHRGSPAAATGTTPCLIRYLAGRRHPAGRTHAATYAPAPGPVRRAGLNREAARRGLHPRPLRCQLRCRVTAGVAVVAAAPRLRRTMHPVP